MKTCISCGEGYVNHTILTEPYCWKCCTARWCIECEDVLDFCEHYERELATLRTVEHEAETAMASFERAREQ